MPSGYSWGHFCLYGILNVQKKRTKVEKVVKKVEKVEKVDNP